MSIGGFLFGVYLSYNSASLQDVGKDTALCGSSWRANDQFVLLWHSGLTYLDNANDLSHYNAREEA